MHFVDIVTIIYIYIVYVGVIDMMLSELALETHFVKRFTT